MQSRVAAGIWADAAGDAGQWYSDLAEEVPDGSPTSGLWHSSDSPGESPTLSGSVAARDLGSAGLHTPAAEAAGGAPTSVGTNATLGGGLDVIPSSTDSDTGRRSTQGSVASSATPCDREDWRLFLQAEDHEALRNARRLVRQNQERMIALLDELGVAELDEDEELLSARRELRRYRGLSTRHIRSH